MSEMPKTNKIIDREEKPSYRLKKNKAFSHDGVFFIAVSVFIFNHDLCMSHIEYRTKQCVKNSLNENKHITHIARDKYC